MKIFRMIASDLEHRPASKSAIVKGFLLAPLAPAFAFCILAGIMGFFSLLSESFSVGNVLKSIAIIYGSLFWLMFSLPFSYAITFLLGIPAFLIYKKIGLTSLRAYLIGSCILGILCAVITIYLLQISKPMEYLIFVFGGVFFSSLTAYVFWRIVYNSLEP